MEYISQMDKDAILKHKRKRANFKKLSSLQVNLITGARHNNVVKLADKYLRRHHRLKGQRRWYVKYYKGKDGKWHQYRQLDIEDWLAITKTWNANAYAQMQKMAKHMAKREKEEDARLDKLVDAFFSRFHPELKDKVLDRIKNR